MQRSNIKEICGDLDSKVVLLSGPRQVGKTTLSKMLYQDFEYYNHDYVEHRMDMEAMSWRLKGDAAIFASLAPISSGGHFASGCD